MSDDWWHDPVITPLDELTDVVQLRARCSAVAKALKEAEVRITELEAAITTAIDQLQAGDTGGEVYWPLERALGDQS